VKIQEILDARHRFVHELDINYNLTSIIFLLTFFLSLNIDITSIDKYFLYALLIESRFFATVECAILLTVESFKQRGLKIEIDH